MPICANCGSDFPNQIKIDGLVRNLRSRKFCLGCSPFGAHNTRSIQTYKQRSFVDRPEFVKAVANNITISGVIYDMGVSLSSYRYKQVRSKVEELGLDTNHWKGSAHGRTKPRHRIPLSEVLVKDSKKRLNTRYKDRIVRKGLLTYECAECGLVEWRGEDLSLEIDHINGNNRDHRIENLRLLCPNCHSQTPTYKGRNARKNS